jgi:hypothetical protein
MNKRDQAIMAWVRVHRADLLEHFERIIDDGASGDPRAAGLYLILTVAFEAGRQFQADDPGAELDNPNIY